LEWSNVFASETFPFAVRMTFNSDLTEQIPLGANPTKEFMNLVLLFSWYTPSALRK
jgi:hypothetical protein